MAEGQGKSKAAEHGTTAHTAAEGGHKASFPPFESNTFASQLVSFAIAFGLLYLIVSRLACRASAAFLQPVRVSSIPIWRKPTG